MKREGEKSRLDGVSPHQRWIVIGTVYAGRFIMVRNWGVPNGLAMLWRGRVDWCQPREFIRWEHLIWAVRRRCELAKLEAVATACEAQKDFYGGFELRVLVRRICHRGTEVAEENRFLA